MFIFAKIHCFGKCQYVLQGYFIAIAIIRQRTIFLCDHTMSRLGSCTIYIMPSNFISILLPTRKETSILSLEQRSKSVAELQGNLLSLL